MDHFYGLWCCIRNSMLTYVGRTCCMCITECHNKQRQRIAAGEVILCCIGKLTQEIVSRRRYSETKKNNQSKHTRVTGRMESCNR